jgi:hypothetical protein
MGIQILEIRESGNQATGQGKADACHINKTTPLFAKDETEIGCDLHGIGTGRRLDAFSLSHSDSYPVSGNRKNASRP